ncbi:hypothetical protein HHL17_09050 [Chitinophaga sp. G-6-1-13]|uniref:Uncharacterized protein n=1 Tax=Chitinophaga fulva TaxID=2728842 RepID=A0A848GFU4_9BACT|nr:hypothetical protein [Chitinophaga fulva]NML37344.1 hypothetical protein [Chitinophaga fulva]
MAIQAGHTPNLKKVSAAFLYHGKFTGMMGQLAPSPSYSLIPHTLILSFMAYDLTQEMIQA